MPPLHVCRATNSRFQRINGIVSPDAVHGKEHRRGYNRKDAERRDAGRRPRQRKASFPASPHAEVYAAGRLDIISMDDTSQLRRDSVRLISQAGASLRSSVSSGWASSDATRVSEVSVVRS